MLLAKKEMRILQTVMSIVMVNSVTIELAKEQEKQDFHLTVASTGRRFQTNQSKKRRLGSIFANSWIKETVCSGFEQIWLHVDT